MLTPKDIRHKRFNVNRWFHAGYDTEEVDDFLDRVGETIGALAMFSCLTYNPNLSEEAVKKTGAMKRRVKRNRFMRRRRTGRR